MLFSSITFLYYFLPITLLVYYVVPQKGKNLILLLASFLFYFWGEPKYCLLMAVSILLGYGGGRWIEYTRRKGAVICKTVTGLHIAVVLAFLVVFKYADFLVDSLNAVTGWQIPLWRLALPIGISFYTFQIISYLVDVYRQDVASEKNLIDFAAYVVMFPQLIAGPIVRFSDIVPELKARTVSFEKTADGVVRFAVGLVKKVLMADVLAEFVMKMDALEGKNAGIYWGIAIAYTLQIYYDFSGYSDMAIGLGRMLGFHFPENFDYPYLSESITEFWRRWHMTLGGWFRDYVYIPMGGNRVSFGRWMVNVGVVWLISGLWHGAGMNFAVWGLYFGILLVAEKLFLKWILEKIPKLLRHIYTMFLVTVSFVIFRLEDMGTAAVYLAGMFGISCGTGGHEAAGLAGRVDMSPVFGSYQLKSYFWVLILAVIGATPFLKEIQKKMEQNRYGRYFVRILTPAAVIGMLVLVTAFLIQSSVHPFLYFRF